MDSVEFPTRKPTRLQNYDYSQNGCYFVTVCVQDRKKLLSSIPKEIKNADFVGANCVRPQLTAIGRVVDEELQKLNTVYPNVHLYAYIIMPDHIHLLLNFDDFECGRTQFAPTLSRVIKQYKGIVTKRLGFSMWQKGFYDRVLRNETEFQRTWEYIEYNALKEYAENEKKEIKQKTKGI